MYLYNPTFSHSQEENLERQVSRCKLHPPKKPEQISYFSPNGDADSCARDPGSVIILPKTQPFRHFPMENFPCGAAACCCLPIHLRGKSAKNRQWRGNGATGQGCRIMDPVSCEIVWGCGDGEMDCQLGERFDFFKFPTSLYTSVRIAVTKDVANVMAVHTVFFYMCYSYT